MNLNRPRKIFKYNRLHNTNPTSNRDKFNLNYNKRKSLLSNSLAPEITHIVKETNYVGLVLLTIHSLILISLLSIKNYNLFSYFFLYLVVMIIISIILIYRQISLNPYRKKRAFISISNTGILIIDKPSSPLFFKWDKVKYAHAYTTGGNSTKSSWIKINELKVNIDNLKYNQDELNYLLKVYKHRFYNKKIELKVEFENHYHSLNKKKRKEYIL